MAGIPGKGYIFLLVLVVLAIGLFFIPEFVELKGNLSRKTSRISKNVDSTVSSKSEKKGAEPLDTLLEKLESGYYSPPPPSTTSSLLDTIRLTDSNTPKSASEIKTRIKEREELLRVVSKGPVTWAMLGKTEVQKVIQRAVRDAQILLKLLNNSPDKVKSKEALIEYTSLLGSLTRNELRNIDPSFILKELAEKDMAVTQAFIEEKVRGTELEIWKLVSLGPLTSQFGSDKLKQGINPPFEADVVVTSIALYEPLVQYKNSSSNSLNFANKRPQLKVEAVSVGTEIDRVQFLREGYVMQEVKIGKLRPGINKKRLTFNGGDEGGRGIVGIRMIDKQGNFLEKYYAFLGKARKRFRPDPQGRFKLPKIEYALEETAPANPRLDRSFLIGRREGGNARFYGTETGDGFVTFASNENDAFTSLRSGSSNTGFQSF